LETALSAPRSQQLDGGQPDDTLPDNELDTSDGKDDKFYSNESPLNMAIDSFLRGEYDLPFAKDALAHHPGLTPGATIESALRSLRKTDDPELSHGAAVFLRFCAPLSRGERWGGGTSMDPWKQVLRGSITPTMFVRRLRASDYSVLLDWTKLDVTDGYSLKKDLTGLHTIAFVNAALFFGETDASGNYGSTKGSVVIVQFRLRRVSGVWLIESASRSKRELFLEEKA
jgi:hypothetical protein